MEGLSMHQAHILLSQGISRTSVAEILNVSRRTVYNYEHSVVFKDGHGRGRPRGKSKLMDFHTFIDSELDKDFRINTEVLFNKIRARGYTGRISILRDYVRGKRIEVNNQAVLRFETLPGHQAQVDWMHAGSVWVNGVLRKRYAFIMKLGYSRRSYVEFTLSMDQPTFFLCMIHAFTYFGGVPAEVLFDNMKTAFLFDQGEQHWYCHPRLVALAAHYGFTPRRCRVYRPETKGKVEREVRYVRYSFFPGIGMDLCHVSNGKLNELVELWLERVDNKILRDFGVTRLDRFAEDAKNMRPVAADAFEYRLPEPIFVTREGKITFEKNQYSAPGGYCGKQLEGLHNPVTNTLVLRHNGQNVRTISLMPAGSGGTIILPEDRVAHLESWRKSVEASENRRLQALEKQKRTEQENSIGNPAIYDGIVAFEQALELEVVS